MLFNIQRWSLHDGPGIRTTVFFKGCPLRCRWCSNPESWSFRKQLLFLEDKCLGCGRCVEVCPEGANLVEGQSVTHDRMKCAGCGRCVDVCPENARQLCGLDQPVDDIVGILEKDAVFYRTSGGGVTFSGGEPFAQMDILRQLARGCALAGIRTAVETSGYFPFDAAADIFEWIDDLFIDLKHTNDLAHQKLTGVSNQIIMENIIRLDDMGRGLIIRIPLIENINTGPENIDGVIDFCQRLNNLIGIELLPYHNLGAGKYAGLGLPCAAGLAAPEPDAIGRILDRMHARGLRASSSGLPLNPIDNTQSNGNNGPAI